MYSHIWCLALLCTSSLANPLESKRASPPTVKINDGTVIGSSSIGIESWKGIPFAEPPVGALRLKRPQPLKKPFGTIHATGTPLACPQMLISFDTSNLPNRVAALIDIFSATASGPSSEDCLTLNVQRPAGTNSTSKLPVVFWIYGGGFEFGSTQTYDATNIIKESIKLNKPIVYVTANYRVGGYGFLAGSEMQADNSTNLGLRDQRLALQWVADNIEAFGGDPSKVVMWGESAGSISVFDQTIINGGNHKYKGKPLFRGAVMDSGSAVPTNDVDSAKAQAIYDSVVAAGGCDGYANTLSCLRNLPFKKFDKAVNSVPGITSYRSVDLSYLPRPDPTDNFFPKSPETLKKSKKVAQVPIIIGDQEDEGTLFALQQTNITTTKDMVDYLKTFFPHASREIVAGAVANYPDSAPAGSPFHTGQLNEIYPQFKRLAAFLGDATFILSRRGYLATISEIVPSWSYLSTYLYGTPVLGTFHATDILELYFSLPSPLPPKSILPYYISFFNDLDPNSAQSNLTWPKWTNAKRDLMEFGAISNKIIKDNFREKSYQYLVAHESKFRV